MHRVVTDETHSLRVHCDQPTKLTKVSRTDVNGKLGSFLEDKLLYVHQQRACLCPNYPLVLIEEEN